MSVRPRNARTRSDEQPILSPIENNDEDDYGPLTQSQMSLARSHASGLSRSLTLPPPRDPQTRKSIQMVFIVLGASFLLPWNGMITATPYFLSRLANSPLRPAFSSYLSITYQAVNFLMLIYTTATAATSSKTYRIRASSVILAMLFLVLTLSTMSGASGTSYFTLIMGIDACLALAASVLNTTVVALAALFGPGAMQACFAGQAAVGVIVSAVQFLGAFFSDADSNPSGGNNQTKAGPAAIFFGLSMAFVLLALIAHSMLLRTPEYADVRRWEAGKVLLVEESGGAEYSDEDDAEQDVHSNMLSSVDDLGVEVPQVKGRVNIWEVAKINQSYNLAVGFCFAVTLSVFPPITAYVAPIKPSINSILTPTTFTAFHFLVFNIGDYLGRLACAYPTFQFWARRQLVGYSVARVLLIPLLLMCNVRTPGGDLIGIGNGEVPLINSDFAFFALVAILGLTNGHCCSLCMMAASSTEHNGHIRTEQVDTAAAVAQFSLVGGLVMGSMASFAVRRMVCSCNPFLG